MDADESIGDWEDKLSSWKQRRRSKPNYQHVQELLDENENTSQRKPKTFQEMVQASEMSPPSYGFNDPFNDDAVPAASISSEPQSVLPTAAQQQQSRVQLPSDLNKQKFCQKVIRIRQLPNSGKGFGFSLSGGHDSSSPVIVDKVVRGGSADVCELKAGDEVIAVNGAEISSHFMEGIEALIQQSVLSGQLELLVRRSVQLGDDDEVFSDDEFEAELQRKRETQRPVVQLFSQSSEPANSTSDDVPPPLPSVPPPPMESALVDELFPSPPAHLVSSSSDIVLESPTQQPNRTSGLSYQSSQQQANDVDTSDTDSLRRSQLRRRMEFLGLKPEDSEEYRALQENKLQDAKPTRQQFFPTNSGSDHRLDTVTGIDARSESSLANTGSISARIDVSPASTGVSLFVNDPPNITPNEGSVVRNDRSSPALRGASSVSRMETSPTRITSMSSKKASDKANEERQIKLEIESSRKTDEVEREEIAWNRRPSQPQHDFNYDDDEQERLRWKQQHLRTEQAKLQRKRDPVNLEKDRLVEAREEQRLLRHIAGNQSVSTPSVAMKQVQPVFSHTPSHRQFSGPGLNLSGSSAQRQLSVTSAPANRESRPFGESRTDDGRSSTSRTIEMLPYNLPGSQSYIESVPLSAVSSETMLQYPQPTNNTVGSSAGNEPYVSTARTKYYDDQANNARRANMEQQSFASRSSIDQSSNTTRPYPVQSSAVAGLYANLPNTESRGYTDQPNTVYRGYTGQPSVEASGYLDQQSADKRSYTSRPGPATSQYSSQPGKGSGASYPGDRKEVVEGYGSQIWQRDLPPKEYSVQAGQVPPYTGPSIAKAQHFQPASERNISTSTGFVGGYDDESSNQSAVDDLFGNTYRRRSTSQNTQPGPTPVMASRSGPLDDQQYMRSSSTTDGPLPPGTVPSYGNRGAGTRSDYFDGQALPLTSAGFTPSVARVSPLGRMGTSPGSDPMSTAYQQPTSYSSYASADPSGPGYGTSAAYNTPRNALLTPRQHSRSSSNPAAVSVPLPTSGSNFSSSDAVDSLFAYHKTNLSSDNLSNQQQPSGTSQYVPPVSAVLHISQQSQYAQLAGPGPAATHHTTNVTRYQYGTDKSMFCIRCGVSLYGLPVRFIDNQLVCTRCDATRSTSTGVRYSEL